MSQFPVTSLYAIPLAIIFLVLFMQVVFLRSSMSLSIGDGGNKDLHERIRRHGNFVEWVPMVMILLALNEAAGTGTLWLHIAGALLTVGRVLHPIGLKADVSTHPLRVAGNMGGIIATVILTINLIIAQF
jgi:uncharacterized protein